MVKTDRSHNLAGRYLKFFTENKTIRKIKRGIYVPNA